MAKPLTPKPLHFNKKLWSAKDSWLNHKSGCEACRRVHVGRPHTIAFSCWEGAQLLKSALAEAAADGVRITDQGRELLARQERELRLGNSEAEHG